MVGEREYASIASIFEWRVRILDAKYRLPEISYLMTSRTFLAFGYGKMLNYYQVWLPALDFQGPFLPTNSTSEVTSVLE